MKQSTVLYIILALVVAMAAYTAYKEMKPCGCSGNSTVAATPSITDRMM